MDKPKPADEPVDTYEPTCEVCGRDIAVGEDVCARCFAADREREEYVESMRGAGRGHLL